MNIKCVSFPNDPMFGSAIIQQAMIKFLQHFFKALRTQKINVAFIKRKKL